MCKNYSEVIHGPRSLLHTVCGTNSGPARVSLHIRNVHISWHPDLAIRLLPPLHCAPSSAAHRSRPCSGHTRSYLSQHSAPAACCALRPGQPSPSSPLFFPILFSQRSKVTPAWKALSDSLPWVEAGGLQQVPGGYRSHETALCSWLRSGMVSFTSAILEPVAGSHTQQVCNKYFLK